MATTVPSGTLITPGGDQGPSGPQGSTALANTTAPGLLTQISGNATDFIDGTNSVQNLDAGIARYITQRSRGINIIHNANFEVDQRNCNGALAYAAGNSVQLQCDRWQIGKNAATGTISANAGAITFPNSLTVPGVSIGNNKFNLSRGYVALQLTTAQATLAAGEFVDILQLIEGSQFREVSADVFSISILCWCTVALNFAIALRDQGVANSLVIPCSIPANTVTLLTFPNLPVWPNGGNFSLAPGVSAGTFLVCLGCGTTYQTSTTGSWVSGNYLGYPGMSNFLASPVNTSFQLRFVQLEPGPICTSLIDKPFSGANGNLEECLRYYQKHTSYGNVPPVASYMAIGTLANLSTPTIYTNLLFPKRMAKVPAMRFNGSTAAWGNVYLAAAGANAAVNTYAASDSSVVSITLSANAPATGNLYVLAGWDADTGW